MICMLKLTDIKKGDLILFEYFKSGKRMTAILQVSYIPLFWNNDISNLTGQVIISECPDDNGNWFTFGTQTSNTTKLLKKVDKSHIDSFYLDVIAKNL